MAKCRFCNGRGVQYRRYGGHLTRSECSPCNGTGQTPLPPMESWRDQRLRLRREADAREEAERTGPTTETTRAATEGGPAREHGSREEDQPAEPTLPAPTQTTTTQKEQS